MAALTSDLVYQAAMKMYQNDAEFHLRAKMAVRVLVKLSHVEPDLATLDTALRGAIVALYLATIPARELVGN